MIKIYLKLHLILILIQFQVIIYYANIRITYPVPDTPGFIVERNKICKFCTETQHLLKLVDLL